MANYPQELAQDAVCQSRTGQMTGLWFLSARPVRLNSNECMNCKCMRVALVIQRAVRMRDVMLSSVAFHLYSIFPLYFMKGHDFRGEKKFLNINCVF